MALTNGGNLDLLPQMFPWQVVGGNPCPDESAEDPTAIAILTIARPDDQSLAPDPARDRRLPLIRGASPR